MIIDNFLVGFNIYKARAVHIRTKGQLIAVIVAIVIYFAVNFIMQSKCKNMTQKKINQLSVVIASAVALILIFTIG